MGLHDLPRDVQPQPKPGPRFVMRQYTTMPMPTNPKNEITSPSTVASRSGMTEKFTTVLSHRRISLRKV